MAFSGAETPTGAIDGLNTTFGLLNAPSPASSLQLFNGTILVQGVDYTLSGSTITTTIPPVVGSVLVAYYLYGVLAPTVMVPAGARTLTAISLIESAMRLINVSASGETISGAEANDALDVLNDMIDSWNIERLMIFTIQRQTFSLTAGQQVYTLGTGGDFNVPRPVRIERMGIINLSNPAQPLELPLEYLTDTQWAQIPVKNISSALPLKVWDDQNYPLRNLSYWCVPSVAVDTAIYAWAQLTGFADLTTEYVFPPGYPKALRYHLACDLAPEYGREIPTAVAVQANLAKAAIKSFNIPIIDLRCDPAVVNPSARIYNWLTDTGVRSSSR